MIGPTTGAMTATAMNHELEKAHRVYMSELMERGHARAFPSEQVKTEPYFIDLDHFREMQVRSGDDLLTAIIGMMRMNGIDLNDCEKLSLELDLKSNRVQVVGTRRQEIRYEIPPEYRMTAAEIAKMQMQMIDPLQLAQEEINRKLATAIDQQMIDELLIHAPKKAPK